MGHRVRRRGPRAARARSDRGHVGEQRRELGRRLDPVGGILRQEAGHQRVGALRRGRHARAQARRRGVEVGRDALQRAPVFVERPGAGEELHEHAAHRVEVGAMIDARGGSALLGSHERGCPEDDAALGRAVAVPALAHQLGDPEVEHLDPVATALEIGHQEDVVGLDVAVDDALGVRGGERAGDAAHDGQRLGLWQPTAGAQPRAQRLAVEQLQHQVRRTVGQVPEVVDLDDPGVPDRRRRLGLVEEPAHGVVVVRVLGQEHLERGGPSQEAVLDAVDRAHAAGPDHVLDVVAAHDLGHRRHRGMCAGGCTSLATTIRAVAASAQLPAAVPQSAEFVVEIALDDRMTPHRAAPRSSWLIDSWRRTRPDRRCRSRRS